MEIMSNEVGNLALALSKAQSTIKNVPKDKSGYNYKYANLASCLDVVKEPFAQNGLSISQIIANEEGSQVLLTLLLHESGQWLKSSFALKSEGTKSTNDMQAFGSGISYARRYALCSIAGLAQEDDDGETSKYTAPKNTPASSPKIYNPQAIAKPTESIGDLQKKLMGLCEKESIPAKAFAKFHDVTSEKPDTVKFAVDNFDSLKNKFLLQGLIKEKEAAGLLDALDSLGDCVLSDMTIDREIEIIN